MADYIDRQKAIDLIAEKQRSLCPPGRWGRSQVYGSDRDKYDSLEEAMDQLENIPAADVAPVVHGQWLSCFEDWRMQIEGDKCSVCGFEHYGTPRGTFKFCPNCGAKMDRQKEGK